MRTKTGLDSRPTVEDVRRMLAGPLELVIEDAVAYWLEDDEGHHLGPESDRSLGPLFLALELARSGHDPDRLLLCVRLDTGERYEVGGGLNLIDIAEHAAGIPRRPRVRHAWRARGSPSQHGRCHKAIARSRHADCAGRSDSSRLRP